MPYFPNSMSLVALAIWNFVAFGGTVTDTSLPRYTTETIFFMFTP